MKTTLTLNGRINKDVSPAYLRDGEVSERRNCQVSVGVGGDAMVNKPLRNTVLVNRDLPIGINKTIGWAKFDREKSIIYCNYNSGGNHGIYQYNVITNEHKALLINSVLAFTEDMVIDCVVIGDSFVWVCDTIEPRIISISRADTYTNSTPVSGIIWSIDSLEAGSIGGTVEEFDITTTPEQGSISGTAEEFDTSTGEVSGTVEEFDSYVVVTGTIIQN